MVAGNYGKAGKELRQSTLGPVAHVGAEGVGTAGGDVTGGSAAQRFMGVCRARAV